MKRTPIRKPKSTPVSKKRVARAPSKTTGTVLAKVVVAITDYPGTYFFAKEGGTCRFVGKDAGVDVTIQVPQQKNARGLKFTSLKPNAGLKPLTGKKKLVRNFMGLAVTDEHDKPVDYFDPAITVIAKYTDSDLKNVDGSNPNRLILLWHDGDAWRRLPIVSRDPKAMTLTALIGAFSSADDMGFGAD